MDLYTIQTKVIPIIIKSVLVAAGAAVLIVELIFKLIATLFAALPLLFMFGAVENCIYAVSEPEKIETAINMTIYCAIATSFIFVIFISRWFFNWIWSNK